jgi:hypothetical protein
MAQTQAQELTVRINAMTPAQLQALQTACIHDATIKAAAAGAGVMLKPTHPLPSWPAQVQQQKRW